MSVKLGPDNSALTLTCNKDMGMQHGDGHAHVPGNAAMKWIRSMIWKIQNGFGHAAWTKMLHVQIHVRAA
jgi:hypothetical protein